MTEQARTKIYVKFVNTRGDNYTATIIPFNPAKLNPVTTGQSDAGVIDTFIRSNLGSMTYDTYKDTTVITEDSLNVMANDY